MDDKTKIICGVVVTTLLTIMTITLIALSIKNVEPNNVAVVYDKLWRNFDSEPIGQGRHALSPTDKLFTFSNVYEPIDFTNDDTDMDCISRDGLIVTIDVVSQYRYDINGLVDMMFEYDKNLAKFLIDVSRGVFIDVCTKYEIESGFINARQNISRAMLSSFQERLVYIDAPSETQFAELREYVYDDSYKQAITNKQIAQQQIDLLLEQRPVEITEAQTVLNNAIQQSEIDLEKADTSSETILQQAESESEAISNRWIQYTDGFERTYKNLKMTPDDFVKTYIVSAPLDDDANNHFIYVNMQ